MPGFSFSDKERKGKKGDEKHDTASNPGALLRTCTTVQDKATGIAIGIACVLRKRKDQIEAKQRH